MNKFLISEVEDINEVKEGSLLLYMNKRDDAPRILMGVLIKCPEENMFLVEKHYYSRVEDIFGGIYKIEDSCKQREVLLESLKDEAVLRDLIEEVDLEDYTLDILINTIRNLIIFG